MWVDAGLDLIEAAEAMAENQAEKVSAWLAAEKVGKVSATRALDLVERDPLLWAVVVSPWILVRKGRRPKVEHQNGAWFFRLKVCSRVTAITVMASCPWRKAPPVSG